MGDSAPQDIRPLPQAGATDSLLAIAHDSPRSLRWSASSIHPTVRTPASSRWTSVAPEHENPTRRTDAITVPAKAAAASAVRRSPRAKSLPNLVSIPVLWSPLLSTRNGSQWLSKACLLATLRNGPDGIPKPLVGSSLRPLCGRSLASRGPCCSVDSVQHASTLDSVHSAASLPGGARSTTLVRTSADATYRSARASKKTARALSSATRSSRATESSSTKALRKASFAASRSSRRHRDIPTSAHPCGTLTHGGNATPSVPGGTTHECLLHREGLERPARRRHPHRLLPRRAAVRLRSGRRLLVCWDLPTGRGEVGERRPTLEERPPPSPAW